MHRASSDFARVEFRFTVDVQVVPVRVEFRV
jgi:hypothetical protein